MIVGWVLGIILSLCASIFGIVGKILLKLSHVRECNKTFALGLLCIVVLNPGFSATAYRFAAQSLLAPMAGLSVVWNTILSPYLLHEAITLRDVSGAFFIFTGCIMVGISGAHTTNEIPIHQLKDHFLSYQFLLYMVVFLLLIISLVSLAWPALSLSNSSCKSLEQLDPRCRISVAALAGLLSGQMYCLTAVMRILDDGKDIFTNGLTYLSIFGAIAFALTGLYLLNLALRLFDAIFVIYIYESCYIVAGAVSGICFFNEMTHLSSWRYAMYGLSLVEIIFGLHVISQRQVVVSSIDACGIYRSVS